MAKPIRKLRTAGEAAAETQSPALKGVRGGQSALTPDLDKIIHERIRLAIISALAVNPALGFTELRDLLKTTDGNLSVHARKLEDAGYVQCLKSFEGRTPRTEFRITASGRRALERYLEHMEALIRMTRR